MAANDNSMSDDLSDSCDSCHITISKICCYHAYIFDPMYPSKRNYSDLRQQMMIGYRTQIGMCHR